MRKFSENCEERYREKQDDLAHDNKPKVHSPQLYYACCALSALEAKRVFGGKEKKKEERNREETSMNKRAPNRHRAEDTRREDSTHLFLAQLAHGDLSISSVSS